MTLTEHYLLWSQSVQEQVLKIRDSEARILFGEIAGKLCCP
jgi:hypothetical protein